MSILIISILYCNIFNLQSDDIVDREYSLYDDNMSGLDTDESGEDDSTDPAPQSSPFSQYQLPSAGMGEPVCKILDFPFNQRIKVFNIS